MSNITEEETFPAWCPGWLKKLVDEPHCSCIGTHPTLRTLAKWLVVYMPVDQCEGLAFKWLRFAADKCDRVPDDAELKRLLIWAQARMGDAKAIPGDYAPSQPVIDLDRLYELIVTGPTLSEFRELSSERLYDTPERNTAVILETWARYAGDPNPWICYGSRDHFYTRQLDYMRARAHVFEQIVPSPMKAQKGRALAGHQSEHTIDGTGPRLFLVIEFDFVPVNNKREPTIWAPLIKACVERGRSVLDMNAALSAHLRELGPLWLVVYSGGKSLQSWFPCKDTDGEALTRWYQQEALSIGACRSTWCRAQFVRMPDGERDDGRRQSVEYYNPRVLENEGSAGI